jgi:hypothetical protein
MQHMMSLRFVSLVTLLAMIIALVGCSPAATPTRGIVPTVTPMVIPTSPPAPTAEVSPTATLFVIPSVAPTLIPPPMTTGTPSRPATPTRGPTLAPGMMRVQIFMVALEDGGKSGKKIGCNDSVVAVERAIPATQGVLTAALRELFSIREQNYGQSGLYNALYQSDLKVESAAVIAGKATIYLTGTVKLGGACDNPRFEAQIKETALQFSTVQTVAIFINGIAIEKVLSEKGG